MKLDSRWFADAYIYAIGYYLGRSTGTFEHGGYENFSEVYQQIYKHGYDAGVSDYCEFEALMTKEA